MALHVRSLSAQPMRLMTTLPTALQERDDGQETPSNVSIHESFALGVSSERESEALNQRKHYHQEADVERPAGIPSEQTSGDNLGGDAPDPFQSDGPERECQQPRNASNINLLQLRTEPRGMVLSGELSSQWKRKQDCSLLSKHCCLSFMLITRRVLDLLLKVPA